MKKKTGSLEPVFLPNRVFAMRRFFALPLTSELDASAAQMRTYGTAC